LNGIELKRAYFLLAYPVKGSFAFTGTIEKVQFELSI